MLDQLIPDLEAWKLVVPEEQSLEVVEQPWTVVASDVMGPFPRSKSGHKYVLVFQDLFTKWVEVVPIRTANRLSIKQQFEDLLVSGWGAPESCPYGQ